MVVVVVVGVVVGVVVVGVGVVGVVVVVGGGGRGDAVWQDTPTAARTPSHTSTAVHGTHLVGPARKVLSVEKWGGGPPHQPRKSSVHTKAATL